MLKEHAMKWKEFDEDMFLPPHEENTAEFIRWPEQKVQIIFSTTPRKTHVVSQPYDHVFTWRGLGSNKKAYNGYHQVPMNRVITMQGKSYLKHIADSHSYVSLDDNVVGGMPVIKGTRVQVSVLLACLRDGMTLEEICEEYDISFDTVKASCDFLIDVLNKPFHSE